MLSLLLAALWLVTPCIALEQADVLFFVDESCQATSRNADQLIANVDKIVGRACVYPVKASQVANAIYI